MYTKICLLGFFLCPILSKQEYVKGLCPSSQIEAADPFNKTRFEGDWFVIQRYEKSPQRCTMVFYNKSNYNENLYYIANMRQRTDMSYSNYTKPLKRIEENSNNGKYCFFHGSRYHFFVDTDYENYGVLWTCIENNDFNNHEENLMVISRDRYFDIYSSKLLNATLAKPPFNRSRLNNVEQSEALCLPYP